MHGVTIQIYCPTGEPQGIRFAEVTTDVVRAMVIPRARLAEGLKRNELCGVGVYYLLGRDEEDGIECVYIGESEDCSTRLDQHDSKMPFWTHAVAILSRTGMFTKSHIRQLEWLSLAEAKQAGRYKVLNGNAGIPPVLPEWMQAEAFRLFQGSKVLLTTLGFPIFEHLSGGAVAKKNDRSDFFCRRRGCDARGTLLDDGFVVYAGSRGKTDPLPSTPAWVMDLQKRLVATGVAAMQNSEIVFQKDHRFESPTGAAVACIGANANGWIEWKDQAGHTLDEVVRKPIIAPAAI